MAAFNGLHVLVLYKHFFVPVLVNYYSKTDRTLERNGFYYILQ